MQQLYNAADTLIVGRFLGVTALSAVGATASIVFLVIGFVTGLAVGLSVVSAQHYGANDLESMRNSVGTSIIISIGFTIILTIISVVFVGPLLQLMRTPSDIYAMSHKYLLVIFYGIFANIFYNLIASIIRALGDSKTPLYFLIIAAILNIILDIVFILVFKTGVEGAAFATVISQFISALLCLIYVIKKFPILKLTKENLKFDIKAIKNQIKIAFPMAFQFSIIALGTIIVQFALNTLGTEYIASYTSASKIESLVTQFYPAIGATVVTFVAQNYGAKKFERIRDGVKKAMIICIIFSIFAISFIFFFGKPLVHLIVGNVNPIIYDNASLYLNAASSAFIFLGMIFVYRNALQGLGISIISIYAGFIELAARIFVVFSFLSVLGYNGIVLANPITWTSTGIFLYISYRYILRKLPSVDCEISDDITTT